VSTEEYAPDSARSPDTSHATQRARRGMPSRVSAVAEHIRERLAEAAVQDMWARYDLGRIVHQIRYDESGHFTARTVLNLAREFQLHLSRLSRYSRVAETIGPREFAEYMGMRNSWGQPLTWSHIERIAEIRDVDLRRRCAEEVISGLLSVRELVARVRATAG
jgi:hypothetical protein